MDDDSLADLPGKTRTRIARGTTPNAATNERAGARSEPSTVRVAQPPKSSEPARSIREAVERLVSAEEVDDDAVAAWTRGES